MAGIYIHVPFCKSRCIYCDFYSTTSSALQSRYVDAVCRELTERKDYLHGEPIKTVYFGGGTPSQLERVNFERIFETISSVYGLNDASEITLEANPDDLSPQYLEDLSRLPFNRLSMGIQTFRDDTLKLLNRRHNSMQAIQAVKDARTFGFDNISIDLMYGLPGQTPESWESDLDKAISLDVEHISAYHLTYEKNTRLYRLLESGKVAETDEENSIQFFQMLRDKLSDAGYEQYEISNFCKPGKESRHNSSYWNETSYLGAGPSAHSFDGVSRQWNTASLADYLSGIEQEKRYSEREVLGKNDRYNDLILTSLRTRKGLNLQKLVDEYDEDYLRYCRRMARKHIEAGNLEMMDNQLRLTSTGIFVSDGIITDLLKVDE